MKKLMLSIFFFLILSIAGFSQKSEVFIFDGAAIRGYDPVAYFTDNKAVKGNDQFSFEWKNAIWHFASAENLAAFKSDPQKYYYLFQNNRRVNSLILSRHFFHTS